MLLAIEAFIRTQREVSAQQIARVFQLDMDSLQPMLNIWVKQGVIRRHEGYQKCASRCGRVNALNVLYEYKDVPI